MSVNTFWFVTVVTLKQVTNHGWCFIIKGTITVPILFDFDYCQKKCFIPSINLDLEWWCTPVTIWQHAILGDVTFDTIEAYWKVKRNYRTLFIYFTRKRCYIFLLFFFLKRMITSFIDDFDVNKKLSVWPFLTHQIRKLPVTFWHFIFIGYILPP